MPEGYTVSGELIPYEYIFLDEAGFEQRFDATGLQWVKLVRTDQLTGKTVVTRSSQAYGLYQLEPEAFAALLASLN